MGNAVLRCPAFEQFSWQTHGFGTRHAYPTADVTLRQIHSARIFNARGLKDREREGDALLTDEPGVAIAVRTADCVPILLLDSRQRVVAAIHAGWRGTAAGILGQAIQKMQTDFASSSSNIWAAIGPCIRECCYEVGAEVADQFSGTFPEWTETGIKRNLNLAEANLRQLRTAGVPAAQIWDLQLCTFCHADTLYSFRREPAESGRLLSAICRLA